MVFVKINDEIQQLIKLAALKQLLGCEKYCDKQIISYEDLDLCIAVLNKRIKEKKLKEYDEEIKIQKVVDNSQVLFIKEHFCNNALQPQDEAGITNTGKCFCYMTFPLGEEAKNNSMSKSKSKNSDTQKVGNGEKFGDVKKKFEKEHPQSEFEKQEHDKMLNKIRNRVERKKYNKMVGQPDEDEYGQAGKGMQQFQESIAFGSSFITLMFLGFVLGYYLGKYIFELPDLQCYVLSLIIGIGTMILETALYIIKVEKMGYQKKMNQPTKLVKKTVVDYKKKND